MKRFYIALAPLALVAGCFDEPTPAYKTVAPETRIYLKDGAMTVFTKEALFRDGLVDIHGVGMTNLSAIAERLAPETVEYLNLDRNALTNVDELADFTSLRWLRLNDNALEALPDMSKFAELRRIYLRGNKFREVPSSLKDLPKLADIDMSGNPIETLPVWLANKPGLENLSFSGTKLKELPKDLSAWKPTLTTLQLGDLELSEAEMHRVRTALPMTRVVF